LEITPHPNPSPKERGSNEVLAFKVLSFGEDLGEAKRCVRVNFFIELTFKI
jgi:hypothetical protein